MQGGGDLSDGTVFLLGQIEARAQARQLFDTWGGLLDLERWRALALPPLLKIVDGISGRVPLIYYVNGGGHLLEGMRELPVDVLSVDWRQPLSKVRQVVGNRTLQGNFDPAALLGPIPEIERRVRKVIEEGRGGGHIFNLGHGILPSTPMENVRRLVDYVHEGGR